MVAFHFISGGLDQCVINWYLLFSVWTSDTFRYAPFPLAADGPGVHDSGHSYAPAWFPGGFLLLLTQNLTHCLEKLAVCENASYNRLSLFLRRGGLWVGEINYRRPPI